MTNQAWNPLAGSGRGVLDWNGQTYGGYRNYFEHHLKAWTPERAESGEEILYPRMDPAGSTGSRVFSTYWYTNLWYLRLRNIEIGYTLPKIVNAKTGIQSIRLFVNGQNLLLWDNMRYKVIDPEMDGILNHPISSTLNIGANITF